MLAAAGADLTAHEPGDRQIQPPWVETRSLVEVEWTLKFVGN
jgi:hypothetical protein